MKHEACSLQRFIAALFLSALYFLFSPFFTFAQSEPQVSIVPPAGDSAQAPVLPVARWRQVAKAGLGDSHQRLFGPLVEFQEQIYAGTYNTQTGCQIWRSSDGETWEAVVGGQAKTPSGFGNKNNVSVNKLILFGDRLYAGLWNEVDGAQLWLSSDGLKWEPVVGGFSQTPNGFGKVENSGITALSGFRETLFAGTGSLHCKDGVELWFSHDQGTTWEPAAGERFAGFTALARESKYFLDLEVFAGALYIATGDQRTGGSEIWRTADGSYWEAVVGAPSAYRAGMGNTDHDMIYDLKNFKGHLYAGVYNSNWGGGGGGALWRSADGAVWEVFAGESGAPYPSGFGDRSNRGLVTLADFGGVLYLGTSNEEGAQLWASADGWVWQRIVGPECGLSAGFGNPANRAVIGMTVFKNRLYVGVDNPKEGGEIWRCGLQEEQSRPQRGNGAA